MTRSQAVAQDIVALLKAGTRFLWIVTPEEERVEGYLFEAAATAKFTTVTWDVAQGFADMSGKIIGTQADLDPGTALNAIRARAMGEARGDRTLWIMRDLNAWLSGAIGAGPQRLLRNLARMFPTVPADRAQAIAVLSVSGDVPPELAAHATVIDWPLPDRAEIEKRLDITVAALSDEIQAGALTNGSRDAAIDAAIGLTIEEATACWSKSLVQTRRVDPAVVAQEKKRVISRERILEWHDPLPGGLDWVGGLENLKTWLKSRTAAYTPEARAYGIVAPRGCFIFGVSGCGKSLLCKAIATAWGIPLVRFDVGALKSKFVGESEQNIRKAFKIIEAMGRCVVWFDEIEKALQGATSGSADGGVSADALGAILTWMQERKGESFVIATANDVSQLPPEFLRKGRWDELWFVDLPNPVERVAILEAALRQYGRDPKAIDVNVKMVADRCDGFTGAEIAALVPDAMFVAFSDSRGTRELGTVDLLEAADTVTPLSVTAAEKIAYLRKEWAPRARSASVTPAAAPAKAARVLDIA